MSGILVIPNMRPGGLAIFAWFSLVPHSQEAETSKEALVLLGSSYDTTIDVVEELRREGRSVGAATLHVLRPFPYRELAEQIGHIAGNGNVPPGSF